MHEAPNLVSRLFSRKVTLHVMSEISCVRCGQTGRQLPAPPFPNELGTRLHGSVCQDCWSVWLREQTAIINHFGLNLLDPNAKQFLTEKTKEFFFGAEQP